MVGLHCIPNTFCQKQSLFLKKMFCSTHWLCICALSPHSLLDNKYSNINIQFIQKHSHSHSISSHSFSSFRLIFSPKWVPLMGIINNACPPKSCVCLCVCVWLQDVSVLKSCGLKWHHYLLMSIQTAAALNTALYFYIKSCLNTPTGKDLLNCLKSF